MFLLLVVCLLAALWGYSRARGQYWRRRGVPHEHSWPLLGSRARFYFLQENVFEYTKRIYWKHKSASAVGIDTGSRRELLIRDLTLVKYIFVTDFASYADRGLNDLPLEQVEPLHRHLLNVDAKVWRWLRRVLSPAFALSRTRGLFYLVSEGAERLRARVASLAPTPVDAFELMARFSVEFISAYDFGIDAASINKEENVFYQIASKISRHRRVDYLAVIFKEMFPGACRKVEYLKRIEKDIYEIANSIQKARGFKSSGHNDFMDYLMDIRLWQTKEKRVSDVLLLDDELIAAQLYLFFVVGFLTCTTATSYTLHLLAQHPETQERARDEVLATLARHNGVITYEAAQEMKYLSWALKESLRLFPPAGNIRRQVSKSCYLPGVGALKPEIRILVPARVFHRDPRYFPNPEEFRPERFCPENLTSDAKLAYMPFGAGPRSCICEKLAMLVSVAGVAAVLAAPPPRLHPRAFMIQSLEGGLLLIFNPL